MKADLKKRALHRSKILEGQIKGLQKMIDQEDYCMDIITQSLALQQSLKSLNKLIVENHITTHIEEDYKKGRAEKALNELLELYELTKVRG